MKKYLFCNNCGKPGHVFHKCRKPINSFGVIAYRNKNEKREYLMICRKDSLGFIDFVRGKYPENMDFFIQNIIDEMTITEKSELLEKDFSYLWKKIWGNFKTCKYHDEILDSSNKFKKMKKYKKLENYIQKSKTKWSVPEWGFPKGRRNNLELDLHCAVREFEEETGVDKHYLNLIKNISPFSEIFMGSNLKIYKNQYYVAFVQNHNYDLNNFQIEEVSAIDWKSLDECLKCIRPYNEEKGNILKKIDKMLNNNTFI